MNRLIIGAALAGALAAGVFIFWAAPSSTEAGSEPSAAPHFSTVSSAAAEGDEPFKETRVKAPPASAAASPFVKRAEKIAAMQQTNEREDAIRTLAHEWAAEDPISAERWAAAFEDPADLERALTHVCLEMANQDPCNAIEMAQWHKLGGGMVETIAGRWAETDFAASVAWINDLPGSESRDRILTRMVYSRSTLAPEEAATIVWASFLPGEQQEEAAMAVLHQWLLKDSDAAQTWVESFSDGGLKERASEEIKGMMAHREQSGVRK